MKCASGLSEVVTYMKFGIGLRDPSKSLMDAGFHVKVKVFQF